MKNDCVYHIDFARRLSFIRGDVCVDDLYIPPPLVSSYYQFRTSSKEGLSNVYSLGWTYMAEYTYRVISLVSFPACKD